MKNKIIQIPLFIFCFSFFSASFLSAQTVFKSLGTPDPEDIEYPDGAPPEDAEIRLGKTLFFDTRLSGNGQMSCATCHNPQFGFSDGQRVSLGANGNKLRRNTPHLYNLAWGTIFFWDGRAKTLEDQALMPVASHDEMNMPLDKLIGKLKTVKFYQDNFQKVYPDAGLTEKTLASAIASFERTIVSRNSPFDMYLQGDKQAISPAAVRGIKLFQGKANCIACHQGPNLTDDSFHNIGITGADQGRAEILKNPYFSGAFKTPGLRNVALTAPYMHDGSVDTLKDVIRFYNLGGNKGADPLIKPLHLTEEEMDDLVAFLNSLTEPVNIALPQIPE